MRTLTVLQAADQRPLTKTIYQDGSSEPYPFVKEVTSSKIEYQTIHEFYEVLLSLANIPHACLLKGNTKKDLRAESRSNSTDPTAHTDWLLLDYDTYDGFTDVDHLLVSLDPAFENVSYIFQHSARAGVSGPLGLRGHVYIMLENSLSPAVIKQWLKRLNLSIVELRAQVHLARHGMALRWPLDITTCQNDKLIYTAAPVFVNRTDPIPIEERYVLHLKEQHTINLNPRVTVSQVNQLEKEVIANLRDRAGLGPKNYRYTVVGDTEIIANPDRIIVSQTKEVGPFIRLNLNGGDSWAYWHHKNDPEILFNFKGEPAVRLSEACPEYYAQITQAGGRQRELTPIVLRDSVRDVYYAGLVSVMDGKVVSLNAVSNKTKLEDFMVSNGSIKPKVIHDWNVEFNPGSLKQIDIDRRWINRYHPSTHALRTTTSATIPANINYLLSHICVDKVTKDRFLNWLAFIFQFRDKTQSAWVFHGTEGTGKGTLFAKVLQPIFGAQNCKYLMHRDLEDKFEDYMESSLILFIDEGDVASSAQADKVMARLRSWITDPVISVRRMHKSSCDVRTYNNIILATNRMLPLKLSMADRRWNIAPQQIRSINATEQWYCDMDGELDEFADYLRGYQVDTNLARIPLESAAKERLKELGRPVADLFFEAFRAGDLDYFCERLDETPSFHEPLQLEYKRIVNGWIDDSDRHIDGEAEVMIDDLRTVYQFMHDRKINSQSFGWLLSKYSIEYHRKRFPPNGIQKKYIGIRFRKAPELASQKPVQLKVVK